MAEQLRRRTIWSREGATAHHDIITIFAELRLCAGYERQSELLAVKDGYRNNRIPIDCIVQDWAYWEPAGWGSHVMDPERYPDPKALLDQFHTAHIHWMISNWPVLQDRNNPNFSESSDLAPDTSCSREVGLPRRV